MAPGFENIFNKVKSVTKQAADTTAKQAKIAKVKMNLMTLQTEKSRHLQTVGIRTYSIYSQHQKIDGQALFEQIKEEFLQIDRIDGRIKELEAQIAEIHASGAQVDVADITDHTD
jgi:hypothetical protein